MEGLFDNLLESKPVFKDKEVLRPSYTPTYLPHRRDQLNSIAIILVVALRGETPSNILVYGKTGTGKTACAKYVGRELMEVGASRGVPCTVAYINCEVVDTQYPRPCVSGSPVQQRCPDDGMANRSSLFRVY